MVFEPRFRMGPPPRSFAADAHDCIMVPILADRPNTSLWRDGAPDGELPSVVMFANTEPLGKICLNRGSPIREFGLVRPNKSAALLGTVKGKSLRDGLRPPLTVPAPSGPSQPVGTRRWSPAHQTRRWNDPRSALTLSAPYKSFDPIQTFPRARNGCRPRGAGGFLVVHPHPSSRNAMSSSAAARPARLAPMVEAEGP